MLGLYRFALLRLPTYQTYTSAFGLVPALRSSLGHTGGLPPDPHQGSAIPEPWLFSELRRSPQAIPNPPRPSARAQTQESPPGYPVDMRSRSLPFLPSSPRSAIVLLPVLGLRCAPTLRAGPREDCRTRHLRPLVITRRR